MALDNKTLNERAYEALRDALISSGGPALGSRLEERDLAKAMGISRTPLREAIGKLAREGLIDHRPYQGNFVRTFTAKEVEDLYEVRCALETLATRRAVARLRTGDVTHLRAILDEARAALEREDLEAFGEADRRFHTRIAELADNATLSTALERLDGQIRLVRRVANRDPGVVERTTVERERLLAAIERHDGDDAARVMKEHIEGVRRSVVSQLLDAARAHEGGSA